VHQPHLLDDHTSKAHVLGLRLYLDAGAAEAAHPLLLAARKAAESDRAAIAEIAALTARYHSLCGDTAAARVCLAVAQDTIQRIGMAPALMAT
jgi:hypothetical protein